MSEIEQNKRLVREFFGSMNSGDVPGIVGAYADDGCCQTMGHTLISGRFSKEQISDAAGQIFEAFPEGITFTIDTMTAEDDRVAVEARSEGVHVSGDVYRNDYHFLFRLRQGKLIELKEYMDTEIVTDVLCGGVRPDA